MPKDLHNPDERKEIESRIQNAIEQLQRGEGISPDELEQRLAKRKEDWLTRAAR